MKNLLLVILLLLVLTSCITVDYVGKRYTPTNQVDMYFDEADIKRDYEVMGTLEAETREFVSMEKVQEKIIKEARSKGADAILFGDIQKKASGITTSEGPFSTRTSTEEEKFIKAKFLKYKY